MRVKELCTIQRKAAVPPKVLIIIDESPIDTILTHCTHRDYITTNQSIKLACIVLHAYSYLKGTHGTYRSTTLTTQMSMCVYSLLFWPDKGSPNCSWKNTAFARGKSISLNNDHVEGDIVFVLTCINFARIFMYSYILFFFLSLPAICLSLSLCLSFIQSVCLSFCLFVCLSVLIAYS